MDVMTWKLININPHQHQICQIINKVTRHPILCKISCWGTKIVWF